MYTSLSCPQFIYTPPEVRGTDVRERLDKEEDAAINRGSAKAAILLRALKRYDEILSKGEVSIYQAARIVVNNFYILNRKDRKNANPQGRKRWYRYRQRWIIKQYNHFAIHNSLLEDRRGRAPGKSLIHDEDVKAICRDVISNFPKTGWSARQFRDEVSKKLIERQFIKAANKKIGRSTSSYWLAALGMECVQPKKGIYKDAHESRCCWISSGCLLSDNVRIE